MTEKWEVSTVIPFINGRQSQTLIKLHCKCQNGIIYSSKDSLVRGGGGRRRQRGKGGRRNREKEGGRGGGGGQDKRVIKNNAEEGIM